MEIIKDLAFRFSKEFLDGFVATDIVSMMQEKRNDVRKKAHQTFIALLTLFDGNFVSRKFFDSLQRMSEDLNSDIRLVFVDSICLIASKLPFEQFERLILPKFIAHLESKHRFIKEKSFAKLGNLVCTINERFVPVKRGGGGMLGSGLMKRESNLLSVGSGVYRRRSESMGNTDQSQTEPEVSQGGF